MASKKENKQNNFSSKRLVFLKKSKKRADSITPIVLFTIALFFLVLTVGRITVLGQMINDIIFTLLFGWAKYFIYLIMFVGTLLMVCGYYIVIKKRMVWWLVAFLVLMCWLFSNIILIVAYARGYHHNRPDHYWQIQIWNANIIPNFFRDFFNAWKHESFLSAKDISILGWNGNFISNHDGGGLLGLAFSSVFSYATIFGDLAFNVLAWTSWALWVFTGHPLGFLPKYRNKYPNIQIVQIHGKTKAKHKNNYHKFNMHELTKDKVISKNKLENFSDLVIKHKEVDAKINQEMYRDVLNKMNTNNLSLDEKQDLGMINNYRADNNLKSNYDKFLKDKPHSVDKKQYKYILPKRSQTVPQEGFRSRTKRETLLADTDITPFAASKDKKISSLKKKMTIQNYIKEQILQETIMPNTEASEGLAFEQFRSTRTSLESKQKTTKKILPRSKQKLSPDSFLQTAQEKRPSKVTHLPTDKLFLADDYSEIRQQNTMIANEQMLLINEIIDKNNLMSQVVEVKVLVKNTLFIIPLNYQTNIFHFYNLVNDFKQVLHNDNLEIKYENNNKQNLVIEVRNKYQIPLSFSRLITSFQKQPSHLLSLLGVSKNNYEVFCLDFLQANSYLIWSEDVVQNEKIGNNIIFSLILKNNIQKLAFAIFDLNPSKENSLQYLNGFSYLVAPVCQEIIPAIAYLDKLIAEIRYRLYLIETFEAPDFASLQKALQPDDSIPYLMVLLYKLEFLIATDPKNIFLKLNFILDNATKAGLIFIATVNKLSHEDPMKAFVTKINNVLVSESCVADLAFLSGAEITATDLQNDEMVQVDLHHQQQTAFKLADLQFKVAQRTVDYVRLNLKTEYDSNFTNLFQSYKPKLLNLDKTFLRTEMYPLLKANSHFNLEYLVTQLPNTNPNQIVRILHFLEMTGNLTIDQANEGYFDFAVT